MQTGIFQLQPESLLIQSDADSCMFGSPHWQPRNTWGSGTCSWSCPQSGRAGQPPQLQAAPQVPIRSLGSAPLDSPLPHPSVGTLGPGTGKEELRPTSTGEKRPRAFAMGSQQPRPGGTPPPPRPTLPGKITLMRCQRQLAAHPHTLCPRPVIPEREPNHIPHGAL